MDLGLTLDLDLDLDLVLASTLAPFVFSRAVWPALSDAVTTKKSLRVRSPVSAARITGCRTRHWDAFAAGGSESGNHVAAPSA
jgi:hypothetical protein